MMGGSRCLVNKLKLFLILGLYSLAAVAEEPKFLVLVPKDSLDMNRAMSGAGTVDCDDPHGQPHSPAVAIDLSRLRANMDKAMGPQLESGEWEVNGRTYVPLQEPRGEKMSRPQVNLMESDEGYIALSARGRVEFRINDLKGSFDGKKVKFKVPF